MQILTFICLLFLVCISIFSYAQEIQDTQEAQELQETREIQEIQEIQDTLNKPIDYANYTVTNIKIFGNSEDDFLLVHRMLESPQSIISPSTEKLSFPNIFVQPNSTNLLALNTRNQSYVKASDGVCILIDSKLLLNEDLLIAQLVEAMQALKESEEILPLVIIFTGDSQAISHMEHPIRQAWLIVNAHQRLPKKLQEKIKLQIIYVPDNKYTFNTIPNQLTTTMLSLIELAKNASMTQYYELPTESMKETLSNPLPTTILTNNFTRNFDILSESVDLSFFATIEYLQSNETLIESLQEIKNYPTILNELIDYSLTYQLQYLTKHNYTIPSIIQSISSTSFNTNKNMFERMKQSLDLMMINWFGTLPKPSSPLTTPTTSSTKEIFLLQRSLLFRLSQHLQPLFKQHLQYLRQEIIQDFNTEISDNLEITPQIDRDLLLIEQKYLHRFISMVHSRYIPSIMHVYELEHLWNYAVEYFEFQQLIHNFIEARLQHYRLLGVLPRRNYPPIELWFHTFIAHPLNLYDYRQNILTKGNQLGISDELIYDPTLASIDEEIGPLSPVNARQILEKEIQQKKQQLVSFDWKNISTYSNLPTYWQQNHELKEIEQLSETMRDLSMFPLFVKNPEVRFSLAKQVSSKYHVMKKKDLRNKYNLQPEKYVRWDIEPLNEVKKNLDELELIEARKSRMVWPKQPGDMKRNTNIFFDKVKNILNIRKWNHYIHPNTNYGKSYNVNS